MASYKLNITAEDLNKITGTTIDNCRKVRRQILKTLGKETDQLLTFYEVCTFYGLPHDETSDELYGEPCNCMHCRAAKREASPARSRFADMDM